MNIDVQNKFLSILPRGYHNNDEMGDTLSYYRGQLRFHLMFESYPFGFSVYSMNSIQHNFDLLHDFGKNDIDYVGFIEVYNQYIEKFALNWENEGDREFIRMLKITGKLNIQFVTQQHSFPDIGDAEIYFFYPNGVWDDDKLLLSEAIEKYPSDQYNWIEIVDYDIIKFNFSDITKEDAYRFYKNDKWDGALLSKQEAYDKYPIEKYEWNLIDD